jgi:hypothetical protein
MRAPNRPLYLRQLRQALRSADKEFDERRFGQRGILDLLYEAQREGLVKLQRDRKGVLRIFPTTSAPAASPVSETAPEVVALPATVVAPAEAGIAETVSVQDEVAAQSIALSEGTPPSADLATGETEEEATAGRKTRKSRTATAGKGSRRKASAQRKAKEQSSE